MIYDTIILGGGLAGLSAGVELSSRGHSVLLLEQKPRLGGRTYSFRDRKTGDIVDNGQHLMMGCYHETRRYLERIGSSHLAELQPALHIDFLHPSNGTASLHCPPLPAPLNVLAGLLRLETISFSHRLRLLRLGGELLSASGRKERELASLTVSEWLRRCGQTEENRKYLWDVIAIGTLNDDPDQVSALLFYRVLRTAFMGRRLDASLLIPRTGLSEILVDPARETMEQQGGVIRTNMPVQSFVVRKGRVTAVKAGGKEHRARTVISALPYFSLQPLLPGSADGSALSRTVALFRSSPIISISLWYDRKVFDKPFAAVLDSTIQWIFNKTALFNRPGERQCLSLVISGAARQADWSREKLVETACAELAGVVPETKGVRPVHSVVIKEKRATFSATPAAVAVRPGVTTELDNLFLAGDWTDTGFPATIEGAIVSGKKAAQEASKALHSMPGRSSAVM